VTRGGRFTRDADGAGRGLHARGRGGLRAPEVEDSERHEIIRAAKPGDRERHEIIRAAKPGDRERHGTVRAAKTVDSERHGIIRALEIARARAQTLPATLPSPGRASGHLSPSSADTAHAVGGETPISFQATRLVRRSVAPVEPLPGEFDWQEAKRPRVRGRRKLTLPVIPRQGRNILLVFCP
jgi:hypothetical protein